jgi:hypothetical protein
MIARLKGLVRAAILFVVPTLVVCVAALEMGLRAQGRLPSNTTEGLFDLHGPTSYRLKKSYSKTSRTPSYANVIHTNAFGFRDRAPGPRALGPAPYYAFLGDSLTFGNGVDYEDSFVGVFGHLARGDGVEVLNLAVGGHHLTDQEEQLYEFLAATPHNPSRVVVVFTAPLVAFFETPHAELIVRSGHLFERRGWIRSYATVLLGNVSAAYCFFRDGIRRLQARWFPSGARIALELMEVFSRSAPATRPEVAARLEERLRALDDRIRRGGAEPVYVYLPSSADLRSDEFLRSSGRRESDYDFRLYARLLEDHCRRARVELVDLTPALERERTKGERMSFMQDPHYTAAVNHAIGRELYDALLAGRPRTPLTSATAPEGPSR